VIVGCVVDSNSAAGMGGGLASDNQAFLTVRDCEITGNTAASGGGIALSAASGVIRDCSITDNEADFGAGVALLSVADVVISRTDILRGNATFQGGGFYASDSSFLIEDSTIEGNKCVEDGGAGWLITCSGVLLRTAIVDNSADTGPHGFYLYNSTLVVHDGEIWGNGLAILVADARDDAVDARHNWWGDASGPYHPLLNPDGLGDEVSNSVWFDPWNVVSGVDGEIGGLALKAPYPNPTRGMSALSFSLPAPSRARLKVYDAAGRLVSTLVDSDLGVGPHVVSWDGTNAGGGAVAQGNYFVRLEAGGASASARLVIVR
jgi:hypothetical protein